MKKLFNKQTVLIWTLVLSVLACTKNPEVLPNPQPLPPPMDIDTARVRLKQFQITNLPSPYYQFVYNDSGYATNINFASGFYRYLLGYNNKRLVIMTETANGDKLVYSYNHGNVSTIDEYSGITGTRIWHYEFDYDLMQRLVKARWFFINGSDSALDKVAELKYHADGNLSEYKSSIRMDDGTIQWAATYTYNNYDDKTNVEDFGMLKNFFEHLLYLPSVRFQLNNPGTSKYVSTAKEREITYQYQYLENLPLVKTTTMHEIKGPEAGRTVTSTTQYSYY